jgi:polysaccharide biosynthesis/export protein
MTQPLLARLPSYHYAMSVLLVACAVAGCQSGHYRAANLPIELRAPATEGAPNFSLAKMSSMVNGTSNLAAGDLLRVSVLSGLEDEATDKPARIADDGTINVPLVGSVHIAGMDEQQAGEAVFKAAVERGIYRNPQVTVRVEQRAVNYVTVLGAVSEPGTHEVPRSSSNLMAAVAAAGGFSEDAGTEVEVLRRSNNIFASSSAANDANIQLASFTAPPLQSTETRSERIDLAMMDAATHNLQIGDQDVVMVHPAKKRVIHVAGLVRKPDQFEMPKDQDLYVLDAIAMAGGKSSPVADKVFVIRRTDHTSEPKVIQVSINQAKVNGQENLRLAPGDLVSVEATAATSFVDAVGHVFRVTAGVGGNLLSF